MSTGHPRTYGPAERAIDWVLGLEGGVSNDPEDNGGYTRYGITSKAVQVARIMRIIPQDTTVNDVTQDMARLIYRECYWRTVNGDRLPPAIAIAVFDAAVQHGPGWAARALQTILGVNADGIVGSKTVEAAGKAMPVSTVLALMDRRIDLYTQHPDWNHFKRGWIRRMVRSVAESVRQ